MISEEDRKRIEKDAIDFIEHIPYLMNKSEVQLGYRHGAKRELILSQSRESSLKEEIAILKFREAQQPTSIKIQELEQQNKELREALRIMHAIAYHLQDSMQLFGKLSAVVPPDIEAKIKLAGEKSELLGKEAAMFDFEKLLKQ